MSKISSNFLFQIVDSGYFFSFTLKKFSVLPGTKGSKITLEYDLSNRYDETFMVPIDISQAITLNCSHVTGFEDDPCEQTWSRRVFEVSTRKAMYGHSNDHYIRFNAKDTKSFLVEFQPVEFSVAMIDIELLLLPENYDYGKYRLRYNVNKNFITGLYCISKIPLSQIHAPKK